MVSRSGRAEPPQLDPGRHVIGEDVPRWAAAAVAAMGILLLGSGVWALTGNGEPPAAAPSARAPARDLTVPMSTSVDPTVPVGTRPERSLPISTAAESSTTVTAVPVVATVPVATTVTTVPAGAPVCPSPIAIWFPTGSAIPQLDPAALAPLVGWLVERPAARLVVRGHATAVGDDATNLLLSYDRARQVGATLISLGVPADRIAMRAAGSLEPLADNPDDPVNQRAVVEPAAPDCEAP